MKTNGLYLTSRGSGVRTPQLPQQPRRSLRFYHCMKAVFYILFSTLGDVYYIGHTTEPMDERLRKHNSDHKGFTGKYRDWSVVYFENFESKALAYARERAVKKWKNRKRIGRPIAGSEHPDQQVGRVGGSNPSAPTKTSAKSEVLSLYESRVLHFVFHPG